MITMEVTKLQSDSRGDVFLIDQDGEEILLIFTKKGYLRGGEIHEGSQYNFIVKGKVKWTYHTHSGDWDDVVGEGETNFVPKGIPHMMEALEDTIMMEWRELPVEKPMNYYEPFRNIVEAKRDE